MKTNRFKLEQYNGASSRFVCPKCGKQREFSRYVDIITGQYIAEHVGRCNREINCGYHFTPFQYFKEHSIEHHNMQSTDISDADQRSKQTESGVDAKLYQYSYIPVEVLSQTLNGYEKNNFVQFLAHLFGVNKCKQLIERFYIGTTKHWQGATVFWQIDRSGLIRTGKIMLYCPLTGKRIKKSNHNYIQWVHRLENLKGYNLNQCLFGEHQLKVESGNKTVAIVESEKTAIIASGYLPEFIWLATGGLSNLTISKFEKLNDRNIILFPDADPENKCFDKWIAKANDIQAKLMCKIIVSDFLKEKASITEKMEGIDLADCLVKEDFRLNSLSTAEIDDYEERAAIMEFDGKCSKEQAEQEAFKQIISKRHMN